LTLRFFDQPLQAAIAAIVFTAKKFLRATVRLAGSARCGRVRAMQKGFSMSQAKTLAAFLSDRRGATAIEYALIASLIAVFIVGALAALGTGLSSEFNEVSTSLK
jgi:pilus assembly protein Flp/PilA